ncbi:cysteine hydrolase family protein [Pseudomonas sp. TCU-HL1]|uniref:cysteine hydrolase family protein n=1 Tax=Pseudomonas sp. TCU-HL1 TaxID=1856685 RepID=UPI00083CD7B3|nr:cysteine hydrolase family protein [Pseudomonas sp. TCU-HL1]AOE85354.1 isochorismatase [Pseudomonas sp. TCU-HL1]
MNTALLIIDVQRAISVGQYAAFEIDRVIGNINGLSARARAAGLPVVVIQHEEPSGEFLFDSEGWQLADDLAVADSDIRVRKTTPDSFHKTNLQDVLQQRGIRRLIVCGLQTDYCVDTSVRRALALGYQVVLAADAHSTLDNAAISAPQIIAHHNAVLGSMSSFGVRAQVIPAGAVQVEG